MRTQSRIARYMMLNNARGGNGGGSQNRNGGYEGRGNEMRMEYGNNQMRGGGYENRGNEMQMEPESRFRDRTGREHYENGRYAPVRSESRGSGEMRNEYEPRRRETRNDGGMVNAGNEPAWYGNGSFRAEYNDGGVTRRMIGFGNAEAYYKGPSREGEMEHKRSHADRGYSQSDVPPPLDRERAQMWVRKMKNEDGTQGEHWTMEQTTSIMQQRGYKYQPAEWYAIMNAMFSDYYSVAKKYGIAGNPEFYADLANAWLNDRDAVDEKAAMYFAKIVKH